MKQAIGKFIERKTHIMEAIGQSGKNIGQLAAPRGFVRREELIIRPTDLFVKSNVGRAA